MSLIQLVVQKKIFHTHFPTKNKIGIRLLNSIAEPIPFKDIQTKVNDLIENINRSPAANLCADAANINLTIPPVTNITPIDAVIPTIFCLALIFL